MEDNGNENRKSRRWLAFVSIPAQMGGIIWLFWFLGDWLDTNHPSDSVYYSKILAMIGVCLAIYNVIRQVNELNRTE